MSLYLEDPNLGRLDLGPTGQAGAAAAAALACGQPTNCGPYIVVGFTIGHPSERPVVRDRALASGTFDGTAYTGAIAITVLVMLDQRQRDIQLLTDDIKAYMDPKRRPRMFWTVPGSTQERSTIVRGVDGPLTIGRAKYNVLALSWFAGTGTIESPEETCTTIIPSADIEEGRTYDLTFDRTYPASAGIGDRIIRNEGNRDADWQATLFGPSTDPFLRINGTDMIFDQDGGLTLTASQSVVVNTRSRTALLNGDPTLSEYNHLNYTAWDWDDLRFHPGDNTVRYGDVSSEGSATICFRHAYS